MRVHINKPIPRFSPMAIDIETSGLDPYQDRLLSVAVSDGTDVWILLDFYGFDTIKSYLEDDTIVKIAHGAKFEYAWMLHKLGCRINNLFDTLLAEDILYKGLEYPVSLEETCIRRVGIILDKETRETFYNHPGFAIIPPTSKQIRYMAEDVLYLETIMKQQIEEGTDKELLKIFELENNCVPATAELELGGVTLDVDLWFEQKDQMETLIQHHERRAREVISASVFEVEYKKGIEIFDKNNINFRSPTQMKALYHQVFGDKIPDTDAKKTLNPWLEKNKFSARGAEFTSNLLKMREWRKRQDYAYERFINPVTGKVHAQYRQAGTDTGRYSSAKPNLQQVPRPSSDPTEPNMRRIWVADSPEYVIIRADYSQQEPRILAQILSLPEVIKACNTEDVYLALGELIFGKKLDKKSEERHLCKTALLGKSYGQGEEAFCETIHKPRNEGREIYNKVEAAFPVDAFAKKMRTMAAQYKYVKTLLGRRRNFDYTKFVPYNEPLNTPVQGTAADMFKLALVKIHKALTELKKDGKIDHNTRIWNIVHDEIEVHCHKDEVDTILPLVKRLMEEAGKEICPDVLHVAEAEYGYRWDK